MLPRTPFQQFDLPRIARAQQRLESLIWQHDSKPLPVSRSSSAKAHRVLSEVPPREFRPVKNTPDYWGKMFDQCWWKLTLPAQKKGEPKRYLRWCDEGEATIYLDGVPYYGIDPGHKYAPLPDSAKELVIESLCARTGIWVANEKQGVNPKLGSRFDGAYLATRNDDAWHAYHDLVTLARLASLLSKPEYPVRYDMWGRGGYRPEVTVAEPLLRRLIDRMTVAIDVWETQGLAALRKALSATFKEFTAAPDAMRLILTGHAHIDLVWLWPERAGEFKAVHSFSNAIRMMEMYPEVTFGYSQPASYEAVQRRSPGLMKQVKSRIKKGQWEPTGALYVESDVQLPCGEALVRAFALGQQGFRELRGDDSKCVWIPDVFGYSGCLPTIMAGFEVPYFYTTKLHWSGATRFPYSSFKWVGMDGSEVVSHISWNHYNQRATPEEFKNCADQHRQSAVHDEGLFPMGYGDGGGGLSETMCESVRRISNLSGLPTAEWGTIEGFFDRLAKQSDKLPAWHGEMYLEYHRGVQTTHSDLKAAFRRAERGLQVLEAVRCATGKGPIDQYWWKRVCFAQFHDYIPGSSIAEVYEEAVPELAGIARDSVKQAVDELSQTAKAKAGRDCVFNPLAVEKREVIDGQLVELPPLAGVAVDELVPIDAPEVDGSATGLSNGRVKATFNAAGEVRSLSVDGQAIAFEQPGAQIHTFVDRPAIYDAWDIDRYTLSNGTHQRGKAKAKVTKSPGSVTVSFTRTFDDLAEATVHYLLERGSAVLRIHIDFELKQKETLVKLVFPTGYKGREARYGAPFGSTKRPQWSGPLTNEAMFENPASRWACVSDDDERQGFMLISEAKFGYGAREGLLHLSLARSAKVTSANIIGDTTSLEGGDEAGATYADLNGPQHIQLAVGRFAADAPRGEQPAVLAETLFAPSLRYTGKPVSAGLESVEGPASVVPCWAVPETAKRWTLRMHETLGSRGKVKVKLASGRTATPTNLKGDASGKAASSLDTKPYSVMSLRIDR